MPPTHEVFNQSPVLTGYDVADDPALLSALHREGAGWAADGCEVIALPPDGGGVSVGAVLDELGRRRMTPILVEDCAATTNPDFCRDATLLNIRQIFGFTLHSSALLEGLPA